MTKLTTTLLLFVSAAALALTPEEFGAASKAALDEAKKLSLDAKYAQAAAALLAVDTKYRPLLAAGETSKLDRLKTVRAAYEERAQWAPKAGKDPKAARALLGSLLAGQYEVETAAPSDKRVAAVLESLRKIDPRAKKFFAPRPVRVVVAGDALSVAEAGALVEGVIGPLRALGFNASAKEGAETLTLGVTMGDVIKDLGKDGPLGGGLPDSTVSCELKVDANWIAAEKPLIRIDLSKRGMGFSDVPGHCVKSRIKEIVDLVAPRLVKRWDTDSAL